MMEQRPQIQIEKHNPPPRTVEITDTLCRENPQALIMMFSHYVQELRDYALNATQNHVVADAIIEDTWEALLDTSLIIPKKQELKQFFLQLIDSRVQETQGKKETPQKNPELLQRIIAETQDPRLRMMLRLYAEGKTPKEIGDMLFTHPATVEKRIKEATYSAN